MLLLKYLSIKDGLKLYTAMYIESLVNASKVPVHKRWIETVLRVGSRWQFRASKVPVHKRWIETFYFKNVNTLPKHF